MNNVDNEINQLENTITPSTPMYVDQNGNPIDPSLIDENGNYIGNAVKYVDQNGNPIDPSLIDENGNYIGNLINDELNKDTSGAVKTVVDQSELTNTLNSIQQANIGDTTAINTNVNNNTNNSNIYGRESVFENANNDELVKYDYNNIPITDIVNQIILDAIKRKASDIHLDPYADGIKIRIRIDGVLKDYSIVPLFVKKNIITRIKIISGLNITESRVPQDGAIRTMLNGNSIDLRVSCLPTNLGEKVVLRIMDYTMSNEGIEALDFTDDNMAKVKKMISLPNGIILVTGATGSGKSTTVYSMLQRLNREETNIITVEDPIEMSIPGINQVQAQPEIGLDFAAVLRSILRQDPDVIMIGEIRDDETARIAVRASITGHLVLSTIHTNNSLATIERLTDMSVERYLLGTSLSGIISQKLARRLCDNCKKSVRATKYERMIFKTALGLDIDRIYKPVGCPECEHGYKGRLAIHEVLYLSQEVKDAITTGVDKEQLRDIVYGGEYPTTTLLQDGLQKVLDGKTSFDEIMKLIDVDDDLGFDSIQGLNDITSDAELGTVITDSDMENADEAEVLFDEVDEELEDFVMEPISTLDENGLFSTGDIIYKLQEIDHKIDELDEIDLAELEFQDELNVLTDDELEDKYRKEEEARLKFEKETIQKQLEKQMIEHEQEREKKAQEEKEKEERKERLKINPKYLPSKMNDQKIIKQLEKNLKNLTQDELDRELFNGKVEDEFNISFEDNEEEKLKTNTKNLKKILKDIEDLKEIDEEDIQNTIDEEAIDKIIENADKRKNDDEYLNKLLKDIEDLSDIDESDFDDIDTIEFNNDYDIDE